MKPFFRRLWTEKDGAELVEWVVVVALIAITAIATYDMLQSEISGKLLEVLKIGTTS